MFLEILIAILIGCAFGIVTGLTPGVHINLVATFLLSITPALMQQFTPLFIGIVIIAMSIVHTFLDILPSTFLGAPDESNIMLALPAHKLVLEGKGFDAVKLATIGSFLGLLLTLLLLPALLIAIPLIFEVLKEHIGIILLVIMFYMIVREHTAKKKFWSFFVFAISGILGIVVFSLHMKDPLFPLFSGLFGVSTLVRSLTEKVTIPKQEVIETIDVSKKELATAVTAGTVSGTLVSIFPGMGPAQAAILGGNLVGTIKEHMYLVLVGAIGTVSMLLSLITLYTINKARNGSIVVVQKLVSIDFMIFLLFMLVSLIAACIGVLLTQFFVRRFSESIVKINYGLLCALIITFIVTLVCIFTGILGLLVLITATALGVLIETLGVGKNHAMGSLLLPVILGFLL